MKYEPRILNGNLFSSCKSEKATNQLHDIVRLLKHYTSQNLQSF